MPVKNIGPGAALNVKGSLNFGPPSGVQVDILPTSLGAGERDDLRVHWLAAPRAEWPRVQGTLDYDDIYGGRWRTVFIIKEGDKARVVDVAQVVKMPGSTRPESDPAESQGWPASPALE